MADDLVLNPMLNENNYAELLELNQNTCFITLHEISTWWAIAGEAFRWNINSPGTEAKNQLPNYEKALQKFQQFGLTIKPLRFNQIWKTPSSIKDFIRIGLKDRGYFLRYIKNKFSKKHYSLSYPIVGSYSDIFIISSDSILQFCHYCGVFAATRLFVEIGLPTAIVLSAKEIITEKNLELQGKALWTKKDYQVLDKYNNSLKYLLAEFPSNNLYLHPIKLSKWNTEL